MEAASQPIHSYEPKSLRARALLGAAFARSGLYFLESLPLIAISRLVNKDARPADHQVQAILSSLKDLLVEDVANVESGIYPASLLVHLPRWRHVKTYRKLLLDGIRVTRRRQKGTHQEFSQESEKWSESLPEYYRRNFHFQTDGYLSSESAELYDHQVELLFRGAADPMRRLILPDLVRFAGDRPIRILELGCGTGSATRQTWASLPGAKITGIDLSYPYIKRAQLEFADRGLVDFIQADAADLPFKDETFDAVVSTFLFHELPRREREAVIAESWRVLRPGGFMGVVDSLQLGDTPELDWALLNFPVNFHEPFYRNYIETPMEELLGTAGVSTRIGFFAKALSVRKG